MRNLFYLLLFSEILIGYNELIDIKVEVRDLIEGEYGIGGNKLFNLVIENKGEKDIILATGTASPWLYYSGFWDVDIRGPIDERCREYEHPTVEEPGPYPYFPSIKIKANSIYKTQLILLGVGEVGRYEVSVKYNGKKVGNLCEYCLKEDISSKRYSFEIKRADGVDREVIDLWKSRNKGKPFCLFPLGIKNEEILAKFPTSTYAGWVLRNYQHNCYDYDKICIKKELLIYRDKIIEFINAKPDFIFNSFLASKAAFISMEYGETRQACDLYNRALNMNWDIPMISEGIRKEEKRRAEENYNNLKKEGKCK